MNAADILALFPLLLIAATSIVVMLGIAAKRSHALAVGLTLAGLAGAFISIFAAAPLAPAASDVASAHGPICLVLHGPDRRLPAAVAVLSYQYFENHDGHREELYLLLLLATLGCAVLVASSHFVSFLLGLEILSVSLYAMVAYLTGPRTGARSRNQVSDPGFGFRRVPAFRHGAHLCRRRHHGVLAHPGTLL